jgi:hypothetical protein
MYDECNEISGEQNVSLMQRFSKRNKQIYNRNQVKARAIYLASI